MAELDPTSRSGARGTVPPPGGRVPPPPALENGDRLTRSEFERRYSLRPDLKKAQLIEGVVHMPSPVRFASHGEPHAAVLASIDPHDKLRAYRRNGVQEYVVWRTQEQRIDWFALTDGEYRPLAADAGVVRSRVFPGLRLAVPALLNGDLAAALRAPQAGIEADEHRRFTTRLVDREPA